MATGAVLSADEIKSRLNRRNYKLADRRSLIITPNIDLDAVLDADSVDLRLGTHFLLPKESQQPYFVPNRYTRAYVPLGDYLVVPAHQTVLGATLEFIKMPVDVSGMILTKSSVARTFIVVETAPWIHPEYRGCLTLEIANVSNTPVLLYPGRTIAQLILLHTTALKGRGRLIKDSYFGPVYPEAPPSKDPRADLESLGVNRTFEIRRLSSDDADVLASQDRSIGGIRGESRPD